jgi:hypothetical protein
MNIVASLLQGRERATALGDWNLVAEFTKTLNKYGYFDVEEALPPVLEAAVPRRGPGRPRKVEP